MLRASALFLSLLMPNIAHAQAHPQIAITFDDLPSHGELPPGVTRLDVARSIAGTLRQRKLPPAYGFINADKSDPDDQLDAVLQAWHEGGQLLANHTFTHPDLNAVTAAAFESDIAGNEPFLLRYMAGEDWHWFRYPYLHEGDTRDKRREVRAWLTAHGYRIAEVNDDFEDYLWNDPYARCMVKGDARAIQRLHDTYLATAAQYLHLARQLSQLVYRRDVKYVLLLHVGAFDAKMLPELLELYRRQGFRFIGLAEAERDPAYKADPDMGDKDGGTLLEQVLAKRKLDIHEPAKPYKMLDGLCR